MSCAISRNGSQVMVEVGEKLTATEVAELQPTLKQNIATGGRMIVFDLAGLKSLDSTGIGLMIAVSNSVAPIQGSIKLVNASPDIIKLLQHMRLVGRLNATASGKEAAGG